MIKTKRFYALVLVAFAAMFLFACGGAKAPTSIEISCDYAELEPNAAKLGGDDMELSIVAQDGFDTSVTWTSSDESIATVDGSGNVTPVGMGKATITATSTLNADVSATFDMVVYGASANDMLAACADYVKNAMPAYILGGLDEDGNQVKTKLPSDYLSDFVTYKYTNVSDKSITYTNNRYFTTDAWNDRGVDSLDTISCEITFKSNALYSGTRNAIIQIHVVNDLVENDFSAVDKYSEEFDAFFSKINLAAYDVPEQLLNITESDLLTVTWVSSDSLVIGVDIEDGVYKIKYTKPLDDTTVKLTATVITASGNGVTKSVDILAKGFSKQDKIDYFKNTIAGNVTALVGKKVSSDVKLPTQDAQFEMEISWASNEPAYLSAEGVYTDHQGEAVDVAKKVTLTATIIYRAYDEYSEYAPFTSPNSFEEHIDFVLDVYPCTDVQRAINTIVKCNGCLGDMEEGVYTGWFPYGRLTRANDQLAVPATLEAAGYAGDVQHPEWKSVPVSWTCSEEGLFDSEWNLLKQYLRYHSVIMTGTAVVGGETVTFEVPLNVGLARVEGTVHAGGSFSRLAVQTSELTAIAMDSLATLSGFDEILGKYQDYYKGDRKSEYYTQCMRAKEDLSGSEYYVPEYDAYKIKPVTVDQAFALGFTGGFGGVTLSWTNEETGLSYTWYATEAFTWVITDKDVNEDGTIKTTWIKRIMDGTKEIETVVEPHFNDKGVVDNADFQTLKSLAGRNAKQYDGMVVVNASHKDVKFPVIYYDGQSNDMYPVTKEGRIGTSTEAGGCLGVYGGDPFSIISKEGIVGFSEKEGQTRYNDVIASLGSGIVDEATGLADYCQYVIMEPGSVLMDCCEGQDSSYTDVGGTSGGGSNKDVSLTGLSTAGTHVTVDFWKIHACNTVTCTDKWEGTKGCNIGLWAKALVAAGFDSVNPDRLDD